MPRPTEPVRRICYADDITVWASGVKISEVEQKVHTYLTEMSRLLWENSLLISAPKSSVTLFTPDPAQANTRPKIKIADSELPLVRSPKILGVYLDAFFLFNNHCVQVANRVSKRNNVLKALAGTNWGQQNETLLMTYKALGRPIANYAAPVWSTNGSESNIGKIQRAQNEALRIITGSHNMSSIDHLHSETKMLQVEDHLNLLSASKQQKRHTSGTSHRTLQTTEFLQKAIVKQSDSSSCPDCVMHPQYVPHLFDCTAQPNDLSPVNLWDRSTETIRELSFLDPDNMD